MNGLKRYNIKKYCLLMGLLLISINSSYAETEYDSFMFKSENISGEVILFKASCYHLNDYRCNLETLVITDDTKRHSPCGIYSSIKFQRLKASRKSNGTWTVLRKADRTCDKYEEYIFSQNEMVKTITSSSKPFNKEQKKVCKKFSPKTLKAKIVKGYSAKELSIGKCKKMEVHMFSDGGLPF